MKKTIASLAFAVVTFTACAYTTTNSPGSFKFTWDWPYATTNLASFSVYWGTNSFYDGLGSPLATLPIGSQYGTAAPTTTSYTVNSLPVGVKFYFVVTGVSTDGRESLPSNQLTNTVAANPFPAPVNLRPLP